MFENEIEVEGEKKTMFTLAGDIAFINKILT